MNSEIVSAKDIGKLNKATDIICYTNGKQINIQVKSTDSESFSGHYHRCDWSNLPTDEAAKKLVKTHCLEGNVDTTQKLTNEQITGLIIELCYGTDADYRPDYIIAVFNRGKSDQELYICSMERIISHFLSNIPTEPMEKAIEHGVVCLSKNLEGKLMTLQRRGSEGYYDDGTPKGHPDDIQCKITINRNNSDLIALFTKIK
jgi:hypothetical protein